MKHFFSSLEGLNNHGYEDGEKSNKAFLMLVLYIKGNY